MRGSPSAQTSGRVLRLILVLARFWCQLFFSWEPDLPMKKAPTQDPNALLASYAKELRESAGLSQRQLGSAMGKSHTWVHNHESGLHQFQVVEFVEWCRQCKVDPVEALRTYLNSV